MSSVVASLYFSMWLYDKTEVLWVTFPSWRAADSLEGQPKELANCPNDIISFREN